MAAMVEPQRRTFLGPGTYSIYCSRSMYARPRTATFALVPRRAQHLLDALVPLVAAGIIVAVVVNAGDDGPLELLVGVAAGAALTARRRAPGITLAVSGA